jgi:hypothetical protein
MLPAHMTVSIGDRKGKLTIGIPSDLIETEAHCLSKESRSKSSSEMPSRDNHLIRIVNIDDGHLSQILANKKSVRSYSDCSQPHYLCLLRLKMAAFCSDRKKDVKRIILSFTSSFLVFGQLTSRYLMMK